MLPLHTKDVSKHNVKILCFTLSYRAPSLSALSVSFKVTSNVEREMFRELFSFEKGLAIHINVPGGESSLLANKSRRFFQFTFERYSKNVRKRSFSHKFNSNTFELRKRNAMHCQSLIQQRNRFSLSLSLCKYPHQQL
jgi:hypothetical protein